MGTSPTHYRIHLEPDLKNFSCKGTTEIEIKVEEAVKQIILNAKELELQSFQLKRGEEFVNCDFSLDRKREEITVHLPEEVDGNIILTIDHTGSINEQLVGFYRSKYELEGETKYMAVTQFEERYARMVFPCFDHPAKKATFDIEFVMDESLQAIANTPISEEKSLDNGKKFVKFDRTPKMSTYLLFFGVGNFEFIESKTNGLLVRVATIPGKTKYGDFGLDFGRKSLEFGEKYTSLAFPIPKCDFIVVPDFAFGAMENYGAITFRENLLLVYPGVTSKSSQADIAMVIAHEVAHMWFGNLVSPADWKYIWLNESFANYFGYAIVEEYYPEWHNWERFIDQETTIALQRDSLIETLSIELPGDQEVKIGAATAPIIYNKGSSVLRMLEGYLDEKSFQKGIKSFLSKFAYSSATTEDYWLEFEAATGEPISDFADSWVHQPGYPLVEVKRTGNELQLSQRRFTLLPSESDQTWVIPITILLFLEDGTTDTVKTLFKNKTTKIAVPDNITAFKVNIDQTGFYRVKYEQDALNALGKLVKDKKLSVLDRFGLEDDYFALVNSGDYSLEDYLAFLDFYEQEDGFLALMSLCRHLMKVHLIVESKRDEINSAGRKIIKYGLDKFGYEPVENEDFLTASTRSTVLLAALTFGDEEVTQFVSEQFQELVNGKKVHQDILGITIRAGALTDPKATDYFMKKLLLPQIPEVEKIYIIISMGHFKDKDLLLKALDVVFEKVPNNNRVYAVTNMANNPLAIKFAWEWFKENQEKLEKLHPTHLESVIANLIPVAGIGKETEVKKFFENYLKNPEKESAKDTIKMALETLKINSRLRKI
ncbi:MAG: M1 family metallopeptidase [Candidatus Odinarchaeota archaeon]